MNRSARIPVGLTALFLAGSIFLLARARYASEDALAEVVDRNAELWQRLEDERTMHEARRARAVRRASLAQMRTSRIAFETHRWSELSTHLAEIPEVDRGWVWRYLDLCSKLVVSTVGAHEDLVTALVSSGDGTRLASGADDGTMVVWSVESSERVVEFDEADTIVELALNEEGTRLVCATRAGTVSLWNVAEAALVGEIEVDAGCLALVHGAVIIGCDDGRVLRWDGEMDGQVAELDAHEDVVNTAVIGPDDAVVTGSDDWSVRLHARDLSLEGSKNWITSVAIDESGGRVAGGTDGGTVRVWDSASGEVIRTFDVSEAPIHALAFAHGELGAVSKDGFVRIVKLEADVAGDSGEAFRLPRETGDDLEGAAFGPGLAWIAFAGADESVRILHRESPVARNRLMTDGGRVRSLAASRDGAVLLVGGSRGEALVIDGATGRELSTLDGHDELVTGVALSEDGSIAITGDRSGELRVWDARTGALTRKLVGGAGGWVGSVAISADHTSALSVTRKGVARSWDVSSGEMISESVGPRAGVFASVAQPGAEQSAWIANGGTIRMWSSEDGARTFGVRDRDLARPDSIAISHDGSRVLVIAEGINAVTYDVAAQKVLARIRDEEGMFLCAAIDPAGDAIATCARDGRVLLWDAATGAQLLELGRGQQESDLATSMIFTQDGRRLIVGTGAGRVDIWETELEAIRSWRP